MTETAPLLEVENLHVSIRSGRRWKDVVRGVSFRVARGQAIGLVGESGSGKTLTVSAVARLLPGNAGITRGSVRLNGEDLARASARRLAEIRGRHLSMVFQDSLASLNPIMRIGKQVGEPLLLHRIANRRGAGALAQEGLRRLGIPDPHLAARRYPHEFSGGMRQRAMIATALIAAPSLVIADEPTTALDATVQAQIIELWNRLDREMGVALILVSHDLGVVSETCDTLAVMYAGRIVEIGSTAVLLSRPQHPYTQALLESMPSSTTQRGDRLKAIAGEPPTFGAIPPGCPFHPRCRSARDVCRSSEPSLATVADSQVSCWVAQDPRVGETARAPAPELPAPSHPLPAEPKSPQAQAAAEDLLVLDRLTRHHLIPHPRPFAAPSRVHALDDVSLSVRRGETLGVAGESGCGKSTLAKCVLRLIDADGGRILFRGKDITRTSGEELRRLRRHMQPVFQDPYGSLNPRARVADIVAEPLLAHGETRQASKARVAEVLEFVGLGRQFARSLPDQLSGGQRQRVGIARAIAINPELIVADEPISALDVSIQAQVLNLFKDLQREFGLTLIFISHDLRIVRYLSTRLAIMFLGEVVEYGPSETICHRPMHPYTTALLSSVPDVTVRSGERRVVLRGEPPSPTAPPTGCRFRTRCPYARQICAEAAPAAQELADGRRVSCHFPGVAEIPIADGGIAPRNIPAAAIS